MDKMVPIEQSKKITNALQNLWLTIVNNCNQFPHEKKPKEVIKSVDV